MSVPGITNISLPETADPSLLPPNQNLPTDIPVITLSNTNTQAVPSRVITLLTTSLSSVSSSSTLPSTAPSTFTNATILPSPTLYRQSSEIGTGAKIAVSAVIPAIGIASLSLITVYLWHKRQRRQPAKTKDKTLNDSDSVQPYLQQKAELDSEERRRIELDPQELRYELDAANERYEIGGSDGSHELPTGSRRQGLLSLEQTRESRGEEHPKKLDGQEVI